MAMNRKPTKTKPTKDRPDYLPAEQYDLPDELLPVIKIVQSLSPEKTKGDEKYIIGAEEGMLFNTENKELYDSVTVTPLQIRKSYVEWVPRKAGGGFVASYSTKEDMEAGFTQGNDIVVTIEYLCLLHPELIPVIIRFDSPSKLGISRKWATLIKNNETMHGARYKISGDMKKNKAQQIYYNFKVENSSWNSKEIFEQITELDGTVNFPISDSGVGQRQTTEQLPPGGGEKDGKQF